ncbi:hypothetical protein G8A07_15620 [Roseateles sp. DAIF2]|uniref:hypothetical protein n=1 Tax=Roseateles sp. DAIF2 TaxID=2714952 RepID=UPI0018A2C05C|nr:hypothetical protein [Roseateles sp. DAIF2]QPF74204.1 hypothetical protein G8A07_15620 [Roseateles sp. DAIF2]
MSGHFDEEALEARVVRTGAYGPLRCEHGTLLVFSCELCKPLPKPEPKIQIGPLDV